MTPTRLRECLTALRWSQRGLAEELSCNERVVRRWASGDAEVPRAVAGWLETWTAFAMANPRPEPQQWRQPRSIGPATREAKMAIHGLVPSAGQSRLGDFIKAAG